MLKKIIKEILSTIGGEEHLNKIYLFGSGVTKFPNSDLDILMVYYNNSEKSIREVIKLRRNINNEILKHLKLDSDIILLSKEEEKQLNYLEQINSIILFNVKSN